jgi:hypothetical protein
MVIYSNTELHTEIQLNMAKKNLQTISLRTYRSVNLKIEKENVNIGFLALCTNAFGLKFAAPEATVFQINGNLNIKQFSG